MAASSRRLWLAFAIGLTAPCVVCAQDAGTSDASAPTVAADAGVVAPAAVPAPPVVTPPAPRTTTTPEPASPSAPRPRRGPPLRPKPRPTPPARPRDEDVIEHLQLLLLLDLLKDYPVIEGDP